MGNIAAVVLAGGKGERMGTPMPKQFLVINERMVAEYSIDLFLNLAEIAEVVVVCPPTYQELFQKTFKSHHKLTFALPGIRRQDSTYNGMCAIQGDASWICVHDAARPLITEDLVRRVIHGAYLCGAAVAAMPIKYTLKEGDGEQFVINTPDRSRFWEIQTPQMTTIKALKEGFLKADALSKTVTDEASLLELIGQSVKLVEGSYRNLKVTTQEDLAIMELLIRSIEARDEVKC